MAERESENDFWNERRKNTLKQIANASATALELTRDLAKFIRMRGFTDINRQHKNLLHAGKMIAKADLQIYWSDLEIAGIGLLERDSSGNLLKFHWSCSMKEAVIIALDLTRTISKPAKAKVVKVVPREPIAIDVEESPGESPLAEEVAKNLFLIPLRNGGSEVQIIFPNDITAKELAHVAQLILKKVG